MSEYSRGRAALEGAFTVGGAACALGLACEILRHAADALDALCVGVALALGYLAADLVAGLVHWAGDRLGSPTTPLFGRTWIEPFREHHTDPGAITARGFVELCGGSFVAITPLLAACWGLLLHEPGTPALAVRAFLLSLGLFTGVTNQLHCWAHCAHPPRAVAALQRAGWILSPRAHAHHHVAPFRGHYCVTSGWLNRPLARLCFFERLEAWLGLPGARSVAREPGLPGIEGSAAGRTPE